MANIIEFDMDKLPPTEEIANCLAIVSYITISLKDHGVANDDIFPTISEIIGMDVKLKDDHFKYMTDTIVDMSSKLAKLSGGDIQTVVKNAMKMKRN